MKVTLSKVVAPEFFEAFGRLLALPLDGKAAYALAKTARALQAEMSNFDAARLAILKKYGVPDGDKYRIDDEHNLKDANSEMDLVLAQEIELPMEPVAVPEGGKISGRDMLLLEPFMRP